MDLQYFWLFRRHPDLHRWISLSVLLAWEERRAFRRGRCCRGGSVLHRDDPPGRGATLATSSGEGPQGIAHRGYRGARFPAMLRYHSGTQGDLRAGRGKDAYHIRHHATIGTGDDGCWSFLFPDIRTTRTTTF